MQNGCAIECRKCHNGWRHINQNHEVLPCPVCGYENLGRQTERQLQAAVDEDAPIDPREAIAQLLEWRARRMLRRARRAAVIAWAVVTALVGGGLGFYVVEQKTWGIVFYVALLAAVGWRNPWRYR
jgi:hypothetical protein